MACEKGCVGVTEKLIEAKADMNLCDQVSNLYGASVTTIIHTL